MLKQRKDLFCFKSWNYLWPYPPLWRKNVITSCSLPFDPKTEIWKIEDCKLPWRSKRDEHQKTMLVLKYQILRNSNIRWQTCVCSAGWITGKLFGEYLVENVVADTCLFCRMNGYFKRRLVRPRGQNGRCFVCPDDWVGQPGGQPRPGISGRGFRTAVFTFNLIQMPWIKKTGALASEVLMILFWRSF